MNHVVRFVRWRPVEGLGLEHLRLRVGPDRVEAASLVIGGEDGAEFGLAYEIVHDLAWRPRLVRARLVGSERGIELASDGEGGWFDAAGRRLPHLDGCVDVDIEATPYTNTPPIRRLDLERRKSADIRVVYVSAPSLETIVVDQRYVRLNQRLNQGQERGRMYRYEGYPSGFTAELVVDEDGLVVEYPGLFRRVLKADGQG